MKKFLKYLLVVSIGCNVFFLVRKLNRDGQNRKIHELIYYKDITYEAGHNYFSKALASNYPELQADKKIFVIYLWDSMMYDFIYKDQMRALDSIAGCTGKHKIEYIFATEMEQGESLKFLRLKQQNFKNVKQLFSMDNYISGLYSSEDIKPLKATLRNNSRVNLKELAKINGLKLKRKPLYLITDYKGKILFSNRNNFILLKDSIFINMLKAFSAGAPQELLN